MFKRYFLNIFRRIYKKNRAAGKRARKKGRGGRKRKNKKLEGIFRANEKGFGFIELEDENLEDVFVPSNSVNGALNGDAVEFVIMKKKEGTKRAEGKVVKVTKRERDSVVGIFQKSKSFGFVANALAISSFLCLP